MNSNNKYTTTAHWTAARSGVVNAELVPQTIEFAPPPEFQGLPNVWTPEHFLVAAVASCFLTTFVAIAAMSKLDLAALEVSAEGVLEKAETGLQFTRISIRPVVTLTREADRDRALRLLEKAERGCLIARSLRAETALEAELLVQDLVEKS